MSEKEGPTGYNAAETRQRQFHVYQVECQSELKIELSKLLVFSCLRLRVVNPIFGSRISKVNLPTVREKLSSRCLGCGSRLRRFLRFPLASEQFFFPLQPVLLNHRALRRGGHFRTS